MFIDFSGFQEQIDHFPTFRIVTKEKGLTEEQVWKLTGGLKRWPGEKVTKRKGNPGDQVKRTLHENPLWGTLGTIYETKGKGFAEEQVWNLADDQITRWPGEKNTLSHFGHLQHSRKSQYLKDWLLLPPRTAQGCPSAGRARWSPTTWSWSPCSGRAASFSRSTHLFLLPPTPYYSPECILRDRKESFREST